MKGKRIIILKSTLIAFLAVGYSILQAQQITWRLDRQHTSIQFKVKHLAISTVTGNIESFSGQITTEGEQFKNAKAEATLDVSSLSTGNKNRDEHLMRDDFFSTNKYPEIKFVSVAFEELGNNKYKVTGDLTIREVTKSVDFLAELGGIVTIWGKRKAGFTMTGSINRFDFGLKFSDTMETGGLMVGETVEIEINAELVKN